MKHSYVFLAVVFAIIISISGCKSYELPEPYKSDFTTSGPLGEDCFQAVIKMEPDKGTETMYSRRESAFIKAKKNILTETEQQIFNYYAAFRSNQDVEISPENRKLLSEKFLKIAETGKIDHEFYLNDDSIVLIYRIYKKGIKSGIISN